MTSHCASPCLARVYRHATVTITEKKRKLQNFTDFVYSFFFILNGKTVKRKLADPRENFHACVYVSVTQNRVQLTVNTLSSWLHML